MWFPVNVGLNLVKMLPRKWTSLELVHGTLSEYPVLLSTSIAHTCCQFDAIDLGYILQGCVVMLF